jgi:hypothetical protein
MTTNNENNILKEQLQQVDLPDVDQAWAQMEEVLDSAPPTAGIASNFLGGFKFYLNLFVGAVLLSAVGFYVASKPTEPTVPEYRSDVELADTDARLGDYLTHQITKNHAGDLPTPGFVLKFIPIDFDFDFPNIGSDNWVYQEPFRGCGTSAYSNMLHPELMRQGMLALQAEDTSTSAEESTETASIDEVPLTDPSTITDETITVIDEDMPSQEIDQTRWQRSQVGLKLQTSLLPQPSGPNLKNTIGISVFARKYLSPRSALFIELGYNPQAIAPTTYVEQFNVFNKFNYTQKDSATVRNLNYVSIPIGLHHQIREKWALSGWIQFSFLTGMKGDLITDLNYPGAPVENESYTDTYIMNRGGFMQTDLSLVAELTYQMKRFELGLRMQQGLSDYTSPTIGESYNQLQALQFRASWLLND